MSSLIALNPDPASAQRRAEILADPGFGRYFTDHMVRINYADGRWGPTEVVPYGPLTMDPATMSLHYGQLIFEAKGYDNVSRVFDGHSNKNGQMQIKICIDWFI